MHVHKSKNDNTYWDSQHIWVPGQWFAHLDSSQILSPDSFWLVVHLNNIEIIILDI